MADYSENDMQPTRLDFGCGKKKREGFLGVDVLDFEGVDLVVDLKAGSWPWQDSSIDEAYSRHFLEHLTGRERIVFFNELYRILKPGATAVIITPHWAHESAYGDPTHEWPPVTPWTYSYLNKTWREEHAPHVGYDCDFECKLAASHNLNDEWLANQSQQAKFLLMTRNINIATELTAYLAKK